MRAGRYSRSSPRPFAKLHERLEQGVNTDVEAGVEALIADKDVEPGAQPLDLLLAVAAKSTAQIASLRVAQA